MLRSLGAVCVLSVASMGVQAASFIPLGDLPGRNFDSNGYAVSADGKWIVGYGFNSLGQNEAFLANIAPVPVPAAVWLFGSALGLMGLIRRK